MYLGALYKTVLFASSAIEMYATHVILCYVHFRYLSNTRQYVCMYVRPTVIINYHCGLTNSSVKVNHRNHIVTVYSFLHILEAI